mgnify:CR=1 FL=1
MPSGGRNGLAWTAPNCCAKRSIVISFGSAPRMMSRDGPTCPSRQTRLRSARSPIGVPPKTGRIGPMQRGEVWFAATPGGDRPVLILTRDPVADRIGSVVVAALTRVTRSVVSELELTPDVDGVPTICVVNFDNLHTLPTNSFRRRVAQLTPARMA